MNMNELLLNKIAELLKQNKKTLAVAESCTGGLVSHLLTNIPGSSDYFKGSLVVYSNWSKIKWLKVPSNLIKEYGAVSSRVAEAMACNIKSKAEVSIGLGITGIAGPGGGVKTKPVGLVYIALSADSGNMINKFMFKGGRISIKEKAALSALKILKTYLEKFRGSTSTSAG